MTTGQGFRVKLQIFHDSIVSQFSEETWAQRKPNRYRKMIRKPKSLEWLLNFHAAIKCAPFRAFLLTEMTDFPTLILTSEIPILSCTWGLKKAPHSGVASPPKATVGSTEYPFPTPSGLCGKPRRPLTTWRNLSSLHSRRLEVVGTRKNRRARRRHACLPRARPFSLSPTTSKRLLRRLKFKWNCEQLLDEVSVISGIFSICFVILFRVSYYAWS